MPYLWTNNKVAVEKEELVPRFWNVLSSLMSELDRYKDKPYGIKRLRGGGNGRKMLVDFDTLKDEIQEALGDPRKVDNPLEMFFEWDADAPTYYAKFKRAGSALSSEEQDRYVLNASVMKAVIKLEQARISERVKLKGSTRGIYDTLIKDMIDFQHYLKLNYETTHTLPTSIRFKDLFKACKEDLYYPLIKDPEGKSTQNARKVSARIEMVLNALFKNQKHKPTPTEVARNYEAFINGYAEIYDSNTGEIFDPKEFEKLSSSTIVSYINKWENAIATQRSRAGDRQKYISKFAPAAEMDLPVFSGSLMSIDDRQPPFWYEKGKRMWFYLGLDVASQAFTTVVWGKSKEGLIVEFYREMVRNYVAWGLNLPYELECESSLNSSYRDTLLKPGHMFQNVRIEANNARGKYIERMFGKVRYGEEKKAIGWIARPTAKKESNQKSTEDKIIIPYNQLVEDRLVEIENWNNSPHPQDSSLSRWDYFEQNQSKDLKPINWHGILPYIGHYTKTSCSVAKINLQGRKRAIAENGKILTGESLIEKMRMIEGKDLEVYWLDDHEGNVMKAYAYYNDKFVCEIMEMPRFNRAKAEQTDACKKAMSLQSAYAITVEMYTREKLKGIEDINIIDRTPTRVNNNFSFNRKRKFEVKEIEEPEIFEDDLEEVEAELMFNQSNQSNIKSWRSAFQ